MTRKILKVSLSLYLGVGLIIGLSLYAKDLSTFVCVDSSQPHGYVTTYRPNGGNPDPDRCTSKGYSFEALIKIPAGVLLGIPIIVLAALR